MNELPFDSETINRSLEIIDTSTKETRKELDAVNAKGINKLKQLLSATPLGIKMDVYIQEAPYKREKALENMRAKYIKNTPPEFQTEPSSYIALKSAIELNYSLDEEHLRNLFENLILSDMDSRKKGFVQPAFIEIIKQLSKEDAETLLFIREYVLSDTNILKLKYIFSNGGFSSSEKSIFIIIDTNKFNKLSPIVIDNLTRLKLIELDFDQFYLNDKTYETVFEKIKLDYKSKNYYKNANGKLSFDKGILRITDLGRNFINVCLPSIE